MKTKIILLITLSMVLGLSAHILQQDFEGVYIDSLTGETVVPGGWQIVDYDEDTYNWEGYSYSPHSGDQCLMSESWKAGINALTPDNWLISPQISVTDTTSLYWWVSIQDVSYPAEHYGVFVSTGGNTPADFTELLFAETLEAGNLSWQQRAFSLSDYSGMDVYLAWRHYDCTDNYKIKLDDILVTNENVAEDTNELMHQACEINQIYPNPFNPETTVSFMLEDPGNVNLSVYNVKGQLVKELVSEVMEQGDHRITWQAGNQPSGMYFFRLITAEGTSSGKALLLK